MPKYVHEELPVANTEQGNLQPEQRYISSVFTAAVKELTSGLDRLIQEIKSAVFPFTSAATLTLTAILLMPLSHDRRSNVETKVFKWGNFTLEVVVSGLSEKQLQFLKECNHAHKIEGLSETFSLRGKNQSRMLLTYDSKVDAYRCSEIMTHAEYDNELKGSRRKKYK